MAINNIPGNKEIIGGNSEAGFIGEVSPAEFFSRSEISTACGITAGSMPLGASMPWLKYVYENKVCFRPKSYIRHGISWNSINSAGAVSGDKVVELNGVRYKVRLMSVVSREAGNNESQYYTGDSEWNRIMYPISESASSSKWAHSFGGGLNGLYTDVELSVASGYSGSRQWGQEGHRYVQLTKIYRGGLGVTHVSSSLPSETANTYGWVPVLEVIDYNYEDTLNANPTISITTTNERTLYENDTYGISGNAQDTDSGDIVSVKYQINNGTIRAISTSISTGASIPFNKSLTFKSGMLYDGMTAVTAVLAEGQQHSLKVWAEDNQGGKSAEQTRTFTVVPNNSPVLTLQTAPNQTFYENDTFTINGSAKDTDSGDILNVRFQINALTARAIATGISDGSTLIPFTRSLIFKGGKFYDGATAITSALAEGVAHTLKVWAEDDKGGKSTVAERTFYVVPNRPPKLTINPFVMQSDLINADKVTFAGTTSDPDGNDVVVSYKLNSGLATEVYRGKDGDWSFDLLLSALKDGENTIVVETVDSYNFKTSLTRKLNKHSNLTPLAKSVQRYTIVPPAGTAQGVLMWIERDATQSITAEISMTNGTEQEQFKPMTLDSSGPANVGTVEDFFKFHADAPAEKIAIKLSWTGYKPIFKVSGALTQ